MLYLVLSLSFIIICQALIYHRLRRAQQRQISYIVKLRRRLNAQTAKLADLRHRRKRLLAVATQALIIVEKDYRVSRANRVAERFFGALPKNNSFVEWTRQHELSELVKQILQGQKVPPLYLNHGQKILEARGRSIKESKNNQVIAVALAIHDVTELHRLSRARHDFVANISHELRTPIASIRLLTDTLLNGALDEPQLALNLITKISAQTDTLSQLAQEVLDLSMLESGKVPLRLATYSLHPLILSVIDTLQPQIERKDLTVTVDMPANMQVLIDEGMIKRVVTNLLHNAIKFTEQGTITLSARLADKNIPHKRDNGRWAVISVKDTGVGISEAELGRVFERFYMVDRARSHQQAGTGLGLAIAKHIVEAHGGRIWATSDGRSGSIFYFTVPVE